MDVGNLEQILIPPAIIGEKVNYLKEGVELKAAFYGNTVFSIELPQFLELMVSKVDNPKNAKGGRVGVKVATLETGAEIDVPPFIEVGDIIKIDRRNNISRGFSAWSSNKSKN